MAAATTDEAIDAEATTKHTSKKKGTYKGNATI